MLFHSLSTAQVLEHFGSSSTGLSSVQVKELQSHSHQVHKQQLWWIQSISRSTFVELFAVAAALLLSLICGFYLTAACICFILIAQVAGGVFVLYRAHLRDTRSYSAKWPSVQARRDGALAKIRPSDCVPGDVVVLTQGERVPTDGRILISKHGGVSQYLANTDKLSVKVTSEQLHSNTHRQQQHNMLTQGCYVDAGSLEYIVTRVHRSELTAPVRAKTDNMANYMALYIVGFGCLLVALSLLRGAQIPAVLGAIVSMLLVAGTTGMFGRKLLGLYLIEGSFHKIKELGATIDSVTMLNHAARTKSLVIPSFDMLAEQTPSISSHWQQDTDHNDVAASLSHYVFSHDATRTPVDDALTAYLDTIDHSHKPTRPIDMLSHSEITAAEAAVSHTGDSYDYFVRGSVEYILQRSLLSESEREQITHKVGEYTADDNKVIALARVTLPKRYTSLDKLPKKVRFEFSGLIGLKFELKPQAVEAIREMGTVDIHPYVLGSDTSLTLTTGSASLSATQQENLMSTLNKRGTTAIVGDSQTDMSLYTQASIGVALHSAPLVLKNSSTIVLANDSLASASAVFAHIKQAYALARNRAKFFAFVQIMQVLLVVLPLALGLQFTVMPLHILWLNLFVLLAVHGMEARPSYLRFSSLLVLRESQTYLSACVAATILIVVAAFMTHFYPAEYARTVLLYITILLVVVATRTYLLIHTTRRLAYFDLLALGYIIVSWLILGQVFGFVSIGWLEVSLASMISLLLFVSFESYTKKLRFTLGRKTLSLKR